MSRRALGTAASVAVFSDMRVDATGSAGAEMKWCLFAKDVRGSVGKIVVDARDAEDRAAAKVVAVFVRAEYRGRGLGEALVRRAQAALFENGFETLALDAEENVELHGRLVALYERCGFVVDPARRVTYEYNGEHETYRKVPMVCDLRKLMGAPPALVTFSSAASVSSASSSSSSAAALGSSSSSSSSSSSRHATDPVARARARARPPPLDSYDVASRLAREAHEVAVSKPLGWSVARAFAEVERAHPELCASSLATGSRLGALGHPDWLELAGYLRHLGRAQEAWTKWVAPFALRVVRVVEASSASASSPARDADPDSDADADGDDGERPEDDAKSGPLPAWCLEQHPTRVVDVERYGLGTGLDETVVSWGPNEFAHVALARVATSSAPREMALVLRFADMVEWVGSDAEFDAEEVGEGEAQAQDARRARREAVAALESAEDADLKEWVALFRGVRRDVDAAEASASAASDEVTTAARRLELVSKYLGEGAMM